MPVVVLEADGRGEILRAWGNSAAVALIDGVAGTEPSWTAVDPDLFQRGASPSPPDAVPNGPWVSDLGFPGRTGPRQFRFTFTRLKKRGRKRTMVGIGTELPSRSDGADRNQTLAEIERLALIGHYIHYPADGSAIWSAGLERLRCLPAGPGPTKFAELSTTLHPDDLEAVRAFERDLTWHRSSIEFRVVRPDASARSIHRCCQRELGSDGRILREIGIEQDITDFRTAEKELQVARVAAEAASKSKSEFLGLMSHELRTPLNAILGFSEVMSQQLFGPLSERYADYSYQIHASADQLLALINDILDLSRIEDGQFELSKVRIDLGRAVEEAAGMMRKRAVAKDLRLEVHTCDAGQLWADGKALQTILTNLVGNSIKFTKSGGLVTVETYRDTSGAIGIRVSDTGIGIPDQDIRRVCEPFFQSRRGMDSTAEIGTGLGLAIVKSLVDLHKGELRIESQLGVGTTVSVRFPTRMAAPAVALLSPQLPSASVDLQAVPPATCLAQPARR